MEGIKFIQLSPMKVDFYCEGVKIASVFGGSVIFHPKSPDVVNKWKPDRMKELAEFMAPFVADMLKYIQG